MRRSLSYSLYKARQSLVKFVAHSDGKTIHIENLPYNHVFEIQSISAVFLTGNRQVLTIKHPRIALASTLRDQLDDINADTGSESIKTFAPRAVTIAYWKAMILYIMAGQKWSNPRHPP